MTYCQVVSKQLHNQSAIFVGVLLQCVQFSNGIIKCLKREGERDIRTRNISSSVTNLLGKFAGLVWLILYLIVEHREVESQSEADGMSRRHFFFCNIMSVLIGFTRLLLNICDVHMYRGAIPRCNQHQSMDNRAWRTGLEMPTQI